MVNAAAIELLIHAKDEASKVLNDVGKETEGLGSKLKSLAPALAGVAAGFVSFKAIEGAIGSTQELGSEVGKLSRETGLSAEKSSELLFAFKHVGLDAADASKSLGLFAKNMTTIAEAEDSGIKANKTTVELLKELGINAKDAHGNLLPMDALLNRTADKFKAMPNGIEKTGMAMQLFGRSGKDMIPLLNMGSEGLAEMAKEAEKLGLVLTGKNVAQIKAYTLAHRDMEEAVTGVKLQIGMALMPVLTEFTKFLVEQQPMIRGFVDKGINLIKEAITEVVPIVSKGVGIIKAAFDLLKGTFHEVVRLFKLGLDGGAIGGNFNLIEKAAFAVGSVFRNTLIPAFNQAKEAVHLFLLGIQGGDAGGLSGMQEKFIAFGKALAPVFDFFRNNKDVLTAVAVVIGVVLANALIAVGVAAAGLMISLLVMAAPFIAVAAAVGLLALGIVTLIKHWDEIVAKYPIITQAFDKLKAALGEAADFAKERWAAFTEYFKTQLGPALENVKTAVVAAVTYIVEQFKNALPKAVEIVKAAVELIKAQFELVKDIVGGVIKVVVDLINGDWSKAWKDAKELATNAVKDLKRAIGAEIDLIIAIFKGLGALILPALEDLVTLLFNEGSKLGKSLANGVLDGIKSLPGDVAAKLKGLAGGVTGAVGGLLGRASGGPVSGSTPYIVGENGPELFVPGASGNIVPNGGGGGGGPVIHVHMEGAQIYGMTEFDKKVAAAILRGVQSGGFRGTALAGSL